MGLVPPAVHGFESNKGYFKDHDVDKAKEHLEKGLKELGLKKRQTFRKSRFPTTRMKRTKKSLKPFRKCGTRNWA